MKIPKIIIAIAKEINKAGGKAILVGGSVRDLLLNVKSKDYDIEIYGLNEKQVKNIIEKYGSVKTVGQQFGVLKVFLKNLKIDFSLPRIEEKQSTGHQGFKIKTDPKLTFKEASRRRDFTINAIGYDILEKKILDPFNGQKDLKNRILRVVDKNKFSEDPLRPWRAMQFVGRFNLILDPKSEKIVKKTVEKKESLSKERIWEEWKKLFLKSETPSIGLETAKKINLLKLHYPELEKLSKTKQTKEWHPEGNVWKHTKMTIDEAAKITNSKKFKDEEKLVIILASLCHDLGKSKTTRLKNGKLISWGHEKAGGDIARQFLNSIGAPQGIKVKAINLIENHMVPKNWYRDNKTSVNKAAYYRLAKKLEPANIFQLVFVSKADQLGRGELFDPKMEKARKNTLAEKKLLKKARDLNILYGPNKDIVSGKDLIKLGLKPSPNFGKIIKKATRWHEENDLNKKNILKKIKKEYLGN